MRPRLICERPKSLVRELEDASLCSSLLFHVFMSALPLFDTCEEHLTELELYVADREEIWVLQKSVSLTVCVAGAEADVVGSFVEVSCKARGVLRVPASCRHLSHARFSSGLRRRSDPTSRAASARERPPVQERPQPGAQAGQDPFRVCVARPLCAALLSSGRVKCFSSAIRRKLRLRRVHFLSRRRQLCAGGEGSARGWSPRLSAAPGWSSAVNGVLTGDVRGGCFTGGTGSSLWQGPADIPPRNPCWYLELALLCPAGCPHVFPLRIDFVCSFCQQRYRQGLLESLSQVVMVINKAPVPKVCCTLKGFRGVSIER